MQAILYKPSGLYHILLIFLIWTSAGREPSLYAQGNDYADIDQPIRSFGQLSLFGFFEMELIPADEPRLLISSDDVDPAKVKVVQRGDMLKISLLRSVIHDEEIDLVLYYVPNRLTSIQVGGGAQIHSSEKLQTDDLRIRAGSGSQVFLEVDLERLDATASEGGHLSLRGTAEAIDCNANTGGIIEGHRLIGQAVICRAGTGGEVSIYAEQSIDAKASTGGAIRYGGEAEETFIRTILGGEIDHFSP
ncbi:MAG: head GIN domain-containing protein [Bacteroidota bacterium]